MAFYTWTDEMSVGIQRIDLQHKKIFALAEDLYNAMGSGKGREVLEKVLAELVTYTRTHLSEEERLLSSNGYPDYTAHKAIHDKMTQRVIELHEEFKQGKINNPMPIANFIKDWLTKHIMGTDKKYSDFLVSKGVAR